MKNPSALSSASLGASSILFVLLCALDSAVGNMVEVPMGWLLADAVVGMIALLLARRGRSGAGLMLSAISTAACGTALLHVVRSAGARGLWRGQGAGALYLMLALLRWHLPWTPDGAYQSSWWGLALVAVSVECFVAWGSFIGAHQALVRSLREQNEALAREQRSAVTAAQVQERLAIAREMHDVLAHRLSLISMHAAALEHRSRMEDRERIQAGALIRSSARTSLSELRGILSDLREDQSHAPQPDLDDLPRLGLESSTAENPIRIEMELNGTDLPPGLGRHIFRMSQEAVTNALRHGLPGDIRVSLRAEEDRCILRVTNPVGPLGAAPPGFGLRGITERVQLCGGSLTRGVQDSTHILQVSIPLQESR